jgi:hypothetical protein
MDSGRSAADHSSSRPFLALDLPPSPSRHSGAANSGRVSDDRAVDATAWIAHKLKFLDVG